MLRLNTTDAHCWTVLEWRKGLNALLSKGVTADYLWYEGSFSYNNYVIAAMMPLFYPGQPQRQERSAQIGDAAYGKTCFCLPCSFASMTATCRQWGYASRGKAIDLGTYLSVARVAAAVVGILEAQRVKNWDTLNRSAWKNCAATGSTARRYHASFEQAVRPY